MTDAPDSRPPRSIRRWKKEEAIRRAEVSYITDDQMHPVEFWWHQFCADLCPVEYLQSRAATGKWVARRDRYRSGVQQDILRKYKQIAVRGRLQELQEIQEVRQNTLELIQPKIIAGQKVYQVHPQSYEGMVRALVHIDNLADAKRDSVLRLVEPDLAAEMQKPTTVFSPDEIRNIARMLLESRRSKQQMLLDAHPKEETDVTDEEDKED